MNNLDVAHIVRRIRDLPPLPSIVLDLISSFEREDVDVAVLAEKISRDPALAAKMLRMANSSFYGLPSKVGTVNQAIVVLGFNSARALAVAGNVIETFGDAKASARPSCACSVSTTRGSASSLARPGSSPRRYKVRSASTMGRPAPSWRTWRA